MEALQFDVSMPRYIAGKVLGAVYEPLFWSGLSCLRYGEVDEPSLPGPDWVKIHTRHGGVCATDWGLVDLRSSLHLSPFGSEQFRRTREPEHDRRGERGGGGLVCG